MKINTKSEGPIPQSGTNIDEITEFVYLETKITTLGNQWQMY